MSDQDKKDGNLADQLFGKPEWLSKQAFDLISDKNIPNPDEPFPVKTHTYLDESSHTLKRALNSRGIVYSEGLHEQKGIIYIDEAYYVDISKNHFSQSINYFNSQNNMAINIEWIKIEEDILIIKTELLPNEHGITSNGQKYYKVDIKELVPIAQTKLAPDHGMVRFGGFNFSIFGPYAIVDLIN